MLWAIRLVKMAAIVGGLYLFGIWALAIVVAVLVLFALLSAESSFWDGIVG